MDICALCNVEITSELQEKTFDTLGIIPLTRMSDSHIFCHGMSGTFRFNIDLPLKKDDLICGPCLNKHAEKGSFTPLRDVFCAECNKPYQRCFDNSPAGDGCAGYISADGTEIYCGWGSVFDGDTFKLVSSTKYKCTDLICDCCINDKITDKTVIHEPQYVAPLTRINIRTGELS